MPVWSQFVQAIEWGLRGLADLTGSAGLSVIIFTLLFKIVVLPLTIKSVRSMYAMQEIQPKIKELQQKYGKDRQRVSAETMKLYQEHGVNPTAGCLPMLLQMPIFFGLYFAIRNLSGAGNGVWGQSFFWIPSLAKPDPLYILPVLAGIFQLVQTLMARPARQAKSNDSQQQLMNSMMLFMPLMVVIIGIRFSSGPVLYWAVSALFSVGQQWLITGWGAMSQWFPFLPELPEHKRLGYMSPEERATRSEAQRVAGQTGLFGALNKQIQKQVEKVEQSRLQDEQDPEAAEASQESAEEPSELDVAPTSPSPSHDDLVPRRRRGSNESRDE